MDSEPPELRPSRLLLRVVTGLLALAVVAQITLIAARGAGCVFVWHHECSTEEYQAAGDQLAALTGTIIALVFALAKK